MWAQGWTCPASPAPPAIFRDFEAFGSLKNEKMKKISFNMKNVEISGIPDAMPDAMPDAIPCKKVR